MLHRLLPPHPPLTAAPAPEDVEHPVRRRREAHVVSCRGRAGDGEGGPRVAGRAEAVEVVEVVDCDARGARGAGVCDHEAVEYGREEKAQTRDEDSLMRNVPTASQATCWSMAAEAG